MVETNRVLVRLERGTSVDSMLPAFAAVGLQVERVMGRLRCVSGTLPPDRLEELRTTAGVRLVEPDREVRTSSTG